jgi:LPS-assembly protein
MVFRPATLADFLKRAGTVCALCGFSLAAAVLPAYATLLPQGFFERNIRPGEGAAAVEADRLSYDARTGVISAEGTVHFVYQEYVIEADRLDYNQRTGKLYAIGSVVVRDSGDNVYEMDKLEVTGGMKEAFLDSMTLTTPGGARITAHDVEYAQALATILNDASYSPCGLCVDAKGRRIGWKVKAARIIYERDKASVTLEQPSLELLGVPVAWLPWFWMPDPSQPRATGPRMPSVDADAKRGSVLEVPFFMGFGEDVDLMLTPTLMTRQGLLARGELSWRLPQWQGVIEVKASGLYQLDPAAFATAKVPARDWRGAIQTSGRFTPVENWTVGWSYTAFTDNAYLKDYNLTDADTAVNQVYATHLSPDTWIDARIQRFNRIGDYAIADEQKQGMTLPKVRFDHVTDLQPGWGRVHVTGELLGIHRDADQTRTVNGVGYVYGHAGDKAHAMLEGAWENQMVLPGGVTATPYLGARLDGAWYDRSLGALPAPYPTPASSVLFSATPIAALDMRWPLMARAGDSTHLVEPIAQIVYRGSGTTAVGITNDDAHSFVFDTSNLFSYNRFSGIDRQETGLRANVGGHYLGTFADGSWLDVVAGQSFHLAGVNALGVPDAAQVGTSTGLGGSASFLVASARGGFANGLSGGVKTQVDPAKWQVTRFGAGAAYAPPEAWYSLGLDYIYIAADPALGIVGDQHEIAGHGSLTLADYWTLDGGLTWDLGSNSWVKASTGLGYDDGYLALGGSASFTPTSWGFGFSFKLKGPDGEVAF